MRGSTFLHPPLRFRVDFPAGWEVANSPQQVVAKAPDADVFMLLQLVTKPQGQTVQDDRRGAACRRPASARCRGERTTINGLDAFVGVYQGQIEGLGEVREPRRAHRARRQRLHDCRPRRAGAASSSATAPFTTAIRSLPPLSAAKPRRSGRPASTSTSSRRATRWQSLAERSGGADHSAATLAVMNHADAGVAAAGRRADQDRGAGMKRYRVSRVLRSRLAPARVAFGVLSSTCT